MKGKNKCRILKELRRQIAEKNELSYVTSECKHQGDCLGTCPKCEAEVRDLERQIEVRLRAGKRFVAVGLAAGMTVLGAACDDSALNQNRNLQGDMIVPDPTEQIGIDGGLAPDTTNPPIVTDIPGEGEILMGAPALPEDGTSQWELMGDPLPDTNDRTNTEDPWDMGELPDTEEPALTGDTVGFIEPPLMGDLVAVPVPDDTDEIEVTTPVTTDPEETVGEDAIPYETEMVAPVAPPYEGREPSGG